MRGGGKEISFTGVSFRGGRKMSKLVTSGAMPGARLPLRSPAFRDALRYRRCLLPADGFYEWKRQGARKQPFYFSRSDEEPIALAGLGEYWQSPDGSEIFSAAVLTTRANSLMKPVHGRLPVILADDQIDRWLDFRVESAAAVNDLLQPAPEGFLQAWPVSTAVNHSQNKVPH